jgi:hypothetical protein
MRSVELGQPADGRARDGAESFRIATLESVCVSLQRKLLIMGGGYYVWRNTSKRERMP